MIGDLLANACKNVFSKKIRSILTILGITIGVMSVIVVGNISYSGSTAVNAELSSFGIDSIIINSNNTVANAKLSDRELQEVKQISSVSDAMPVVALNTQVKSVKDKIDTFVLGVDINAQNIIELNVVNGRFINQSDIKNSENVCIVDQNTAKKLCGNDSMVDYDILVVEDGKSVRYKVVGIVKTGSGLIDSCFGSDMPNFVYVPCTTLQNSMGQDYFDRIVVKAKEGKDINQVSDKIISCLEKSCGVHGAFSSNSMSRQKNILSKVLKIISLILTGIGAIALIVANISIMTLMLVSVNERKKEIGIKKSLGATQKIILLEFLFEALLITVIGCFVGVCSSFGIKKLIQEFVTPRYMSSGHVIFETILFSLITGVVFGVYPAYKASRLKPVDALKADG